MNTMITTVILSIAETLTFHYFSICYRSNQSKPVQAAGLCLTALLIWALHYAMLPFYTHCLIQLAIFVLLCLLQKRMSFKTSLYICGIYIMILELSHSLIDDVLRNLLLQQLLHTSIGAREGIVNTMLYVACVATISFALYGRVNRHNKDNIRVRELLLPFITIIPFLYLRTYEFTLFGEKEGLPYQIYLTILLMCISSLIVVVYTENNLSEQIVKGELKNLMLLLEQQKKQYSARQDTVEKINKNYHDLKYIISLLDSNRLAENREYLQQIKQDISLYEDQQETGSEVLNILLQESLEKCRTRNIRVVPYINGREVVFMNQLDLSILFGNAMDNAIEACEKMNEERRYIYVKIARVKHMVFMRFENPYFGCIDDLKTTKDPMFHGFGIKSIRSISEKYGGVVSINHDGGMFTLTIMFNRPDVKTE